MGTYRLRLDGHTARLNQLIGCHWGTASKLKRRDRQWVALAARQAGVPAACGRRRVSLVVTMGPRQRKPDPDSFWKSALDALVACGALADDNPNGVDLGPVSYDRGKAPSMLVVLEDVP